MVLPPPAPLSICPDFAEIIPCKDGTFWVDWRLVRKIVESCYRQQAMNDFGRVKIDREWIGPDIHSFEVDWAAVRKQSRSATDHVLTAFRQQLWKKVTPMNEQFKVLLMVYQRIGHTQRDMWRKKMNDATSRTMENIEKSVDRLENAKYTAEIVRDVSAGALVAGATVLSGGAALAVLGAGSALKGVAKYQDTGKLSTEQRVSAAMLEFTGSMVFGLIPVAKAGMVGKATLSAREEAAEVIVLTLVDGQFATAQALLEGKALEEALVIGSLKALDPTAGQLFKVPAVKGMLNKSLLPVFTSKKMTAASREMAVKGASAMIEQTAKYAVGKGGEKLVKPMFAVPPKPAYKPAPDGRAADNPIIVNEQLYRRLVEQAIRRV